MLAEKLLLHVLIVLAPFLIYSVYFDKRKQGKMNLFIGIINGIVATIVMIFPIYSNGLHFDLRYVPLVVATLYGGPVPGGIVLVMILLQRTLSGGDAILYGYISALIGFLLPLFIGRIFMRYPPKMRVGIITILGVWPTIICIVSTYFYFSGRGQNYAEYADTIHELLIVGSIQTIAIGLAALLTEIILEKAQMNDSIRRSEKLNTLGELAASIAHEVRNPLTVVKGFLQLLQQEEKGRKHEYLSLVLMELSRAEIIINDYLNFGKPKLENIEEVQLHDVIIDVVHLLNPLAIKEGIDICYDKIEKYILKTDRNQLKQVLVNLIKNSIEATPNGGSVTITSEKQNNHVVITIDDTGKGMDEKQLERIGTLFYTTKDKGTGLGTMVSIRIIETMKGKIGFSSQKGIGTKVKITLPLYIKKEA